MRRRDFITLVGSLASTVGLAAPAVAQTMPMIGFLNTASPGPVAPLLGAFRKALGAAGYVEGRNLTIEYRWAEGRYERLESLAADLVHRKAVLIAATGGTVAAKAVTAVTSTIPVLFIAGFDPVQEGLVASINRPGGNATGVGVYTAELGKKRLAMLQQIVPGRPLSMLVNPAATSTVVEIHDAEDAAKLLGFELIVLRAQTDDEITKGFDGAMKAGAGALLVSADSYFTSRRAEIVALAAHHRLPVCYPWPQYVDAGGLISYGTNLVWAYEQIGAYAAQILRGDKPGDLPVQLPTTFDTIINLKAAKLLNITIPAVLLVGAARVIE